VADFDRKPFPDLGPKVVNKLLQERLSKIVIGNREVPVVWVDDKSAAKKEIFPAIYIEFIDLQPAPDRQFSGILECEADPLADGTYAETATIKYPDAYFASYDVHLQSENMDDMVELVTEVVKRVPKDGHLFEIDGKFRLAVQRPGAALNADVPEEMFFHRIYTYQVETYIFDYDSLESAPNLLETGLIIEVKDD
jgi:hypothetical protein